jgi:hypothetical protein
MKMDDELMGQLETHCSEIDRLWAENRDVHLENEQFRREIERLRAEREWRPIETAPKDGRTILVYRRCHDWDVLGTAYWAGSEHLAGWISSGIHEPPGNLGLAAPTHWMPLPAPPETN